MSQSIAKDPASLSFGGVVLISHIFFMLLVVMRKGRANARPFLFFEGRGFTFLEK